MASLLISDKAVPFHKASAVPGFRQPSLQAHNTGTADDSAMDYGGLRKSDGDIFRSYRPVWQALLRDMFLLEQTV